VLDCSVRLTGDLWSEGDVQLDGHLCGNISCGQLIVGKDAAVTGVIIAQEAVIRGKITGIIRATRVLLQETARVESEIIYRTLAVDEGATFEGIARPRPNPLAEDFTVPAMPEARGRMGEPEVAANGAGAERAMAGQAGALAAADTRRQLEGPSAARG
jgi:cytoskeletal protein CcmA (bactofilin family)